MPKHDSASGSVFAPCLNLTLMLVFNRGSPNTNWHTFSVLGMYANASLSTFASPDKELK